MNYVIFRSQPIMTINDLSQIGSHNKREKQVDKFALGLFKKMKKIIILIKKKIKLAEDLSMPTISN